MRQFELDYFEPKPGSGLYWVVGEVEAIRVGLQVAIPSVQLFDIYKGTVELYAHIWYDITLPEEDPDGIFEEDTEDEIIRRVLPLVPVHQSWQGCVNPTPRYTQIELPTTINSPTQLRNKLQVEEGGKLSGQVFRFLWNKVLTRSEHWHVTPQSFHELFTSLRGQALAQNSHKIYSLAMEYEEGRRQGAMPPI